ncbi:hypothetical protein NAT51_15325 [Flavobacterium amniphilum]|uniref:hypothetical protein n=1 Tax=Flavobacterium amniphilum TaxID=1834035 RepID=UPI00202AA470|nr:hypothetical protein [Flavobacterium amniphilum]MCL9806906.1 hypothetical protein [Flavobacterium amniphilum]
MDSVSDKFGKYLFEIILDNRAYLFVWGIDLSSDNEYILRNNENKIILFLNFLELKKFICDNVFFDELVEWVNNVEDNENDKVLLDFENELNSLKVLDDRFLELWKDISLFIELYDDLIYLNNDEDKLVLNKDVERFKEQYRDNFIWRNEIKKEFIIETNFIKGLNEMSGYIKSSIAIFMND